MSGYTTRGKSSIGTMKTLVEEFPELDRYLGDNHGNPY